MNLTCKQCGGGYDTDTSCTAVETYHYCSALCEIHAKYGKQHALDILGALAWYHKLLVEAWDATSTHEGDNEREKQEVDIYLPRRWFLEVDELLNRNSAITESKEEEEKPVGYKFGVGKHENAEGKTVEIIAEIPPEMGLGVTGNHTLVGVVENCAGGRYLFTYRKDGTTGKYASTDDLVPPVTTRWLAINIAGTARKWWDTKAEAIADDAPLQGYRILFFLTADFGPDNLIVPGSAKVHPV